ncbi:MAG: hypothetical protein ABFS14_07025 [Gemmatimonadota bacterium]
MPRLSLALALLAVSAQSLVAQDYHAVMEAKADSLRAVYECPDVESWPALPAVGRQTFHSMVLDSAGNMTPADPAQIARPDIVIPQYAYIYNEMAERCLPVIVVQAEGRNLGWESVLPPPPAAGGIYEAFVDLLGTDPTSPGMQIEAEVGSSDAPPN